MLEMCGDLKRSINKTNGIVLYQGGLKGTNFKFLLCLDMNFMVAWLGGTNTFHFVTSLIFYLALSRSALIRMSPVWNKAK